MAILKGCQHTSVEWHTVAGGLLFDHVGWWSPFVLTAVAMLGAALMATVVTLSTSD